MNEFGITWIVRINPFQVPKEKSTSLLMMIIMCICHTIEIWIRYVQRHKLVMKRYPIVTKSNYVPPRTLFTAQYCKHS